MPLLILLGIFAGYGAVSFAQSCEKSAPPMNKSTGDRMTNEMIGKSKKECRKILKKYNGGWLYR